MQGRQCLPSRTSTRPQTSTDGGRKITGRGRRLHREHPRDPTIAPAERPAGNDHECSKKPRCVRRFTIRNTVAAFMFLSPPSSDTRFTTSAVEPCPISEMMDSTNTSFGNNRSPDPLRTEISVHMAMHARCFQECRPSARTIHHKRSLIYQENWAERRYLSQSIRGAQTSRRRGCPTIDNCNIQPEAQ